MNKLLISADKAMDEFDNLINYVINTHRHLVLIGENNNAVLLSEENWVVIQQILNRSNI